MRRLAFLAVVAINAVVSFLQARGLAFDRDQRFLYVANTGDRRILRIPVLRDGSAGAIEKPSALEAHFSAVVQNDMLHQLGRTPR